MDIYNKIIVGTIIFMVGLGAVTVSCSNNNSSSEKKLPPPLPSQFVETQDTDLNWYGIKTLRNNSDHITCYVLYMNDSRAGFQCIKDTTDAGQ